MCPGRPGHIVGRDASEHVSSAICGRGCFQIGLTLGAWKTPGATSWSWPSRNLTGGEPTLHPALAAVVRVGTAVGLRVCITSNGERGERVLDECAKAGLDRINFSIFGTTADELAQVQHARFASVRLTERKIEALRASIKSAVRLGVKASTNIVVPNYEHAPRVHRLLDECVPDVSVRLLNSLDEGQGSIDAIERVLADLQAVPFAHHLTACVSGSRTAFRLPNGRVIWFKQIRSVRLPETCSTCRFNNDTDCQEGFYGVRLYRTFTE